VAYAVKNQTGEKGGKIKRQEKTKKKIPVSRTLLFGQPKKGKRTRGDGGWDESDKREGAEK